MNNTLILVLPEKYQGIRIEIDASTLSFSGGTSGYNNSNKEDSWLSFVPTEQELDKEQLCSDLRNILNLNVKKEDYVHLRTKFESWESDTRPRMSVRLQQGYAGLLNPSSFYLRDKR